MSEVYRKGVNVKEGQGISPVEGLSQTVTGLMLTLERGPVNLVTMVYSLAEAERTFGSKALSLGTSRQELKNFFASAGEAPLAIVNVKGASAVKANKTIVDIDGTPESTIKIEAKSEGAWGNNLSISIANASILSTTLTATISSSAVTATLTSTAGLEIGSVLQFDDTTNDEKVVLTSVDPATGIVQWVGGTANGFADSNTVVASQEFTISVYENGVLVETNANLSMNEDVSFFCETVINNTGTTGSNYIKATDLDSASALMYDTWPAVTALTALTSGDDDLTSLEVADWTGVSSNGTGVHAFNGVDNLFRIGCPNPIINTTPETGIITVVQALLAFANQVEDLQVYAEVPYNKTPAEAVTFRNNFEGRRISFWYPWLIFESAGVTTSPTGAVLGVAASKDYRRGLFKNVGNEKLGLSARLERVIGPTEGETLNNAEVNEIQSRQGLWTWGGRTASALTAHRFINHSELFNWISATFKLELVDVTFEPNTAITRASLVRRLTAFFNRLVVDQSITAYAIVCDTTNNPQDQIALGRLFCNIEYVPAGVAEKIIFTVTSSPAGLTINQ